MYSCSTSCIYYFSFPRIHRAIPHSFPLCALSLKLHNFSWNQVPFFNGLAITFWKLATFIWDHLSIASSMQFWGWKMEIVGNAAIPGGWSWLWFISVNNYKKQPFHLPLFCTMQWGIRIMSVTSGVNLSPIRVLERPESISYEISFPIPGAHLVSQHSVHFQERIGRLELCKPDIFSFFVCTGRQKTTMMFMFVTQQKHYTKQKASLSPHPPPPGFSVKPTFPRDQQAPDKTRQLKTRKTNSNLTK